MEKRQIPEPYPMFGGDFPESSELPSGAIPVKWQGSPSPMADVLPQIVYQERSGEQQHIQLFKPMQPPMLPEASPVIYPVIVYVPGSAWHRQNVWMGLSKALAALERGFAFAIVEYRPSDIAPFPAQVEDAKSAVRFLKANAQRFGLDKDRFALWGDSSGGHTVSFAAITADACFNDGILQEESSEVRCVVDWFGPVDIAEMNYYPSGMEHHTADSPEGFLIGRRDVLENPTLTENTNPMRYVTAEKATPPFLIMHGSADRLVPFNQSVLLYEKLKAMGKEVTFYKLLGAGHGTEGFESSEAMQVVLDFIVEKLK